MPVAPAPSPRIVTAALLWRGGRVLVAQRGDAKHLGKWEFPGGKLEAGETPEAGLTRELHEELGITASIGAFFASSDFVYPGGAIHLLAYHARWTGGVMTPFEHAALKWCEPADLAALPFLGADIPLVAQLIRDWDALVAEHGTATGPIA